MDEHSIRIVYLGIDVHKKTYSITAVQDRTIVKRASMPAIPTALLSFIKSHFPNCEIFSAYEAGFSGFGLHRFLLKNEIQNIVVHPGSIEVAVNNRSKTDKRDSEKIASQLAQGKLRCVNVPSVKRESWRAVTRVRLQLVRRKAQTACQIKSLLHYFGILPHDYSKRTSKKWLISLLLILKDKIDSDVFFSLKALIDHWLYLNKSIKEIEKRIYAQAREDLDIGKVYLETMGIGLLSSRILANELDDLTQFHSQSALFSFIGLTPREYSSGEHTRMGNISRMGNPIIRKILVESAWKAILKDPYLKNVFERIQRNTGSRKKAIVAIAKKMIGIIRSKFLSRKVELCIR